MDRHRVDGTGGVADSITLMAAHDTGSSRTTDAASTSHGTKIALAFAALQAGDAVACATLPAIRDDLDRLGCPPALQRALPAIKASSAVGLALGTRFPRLGRLTAMSLVAYFLAAIGFHVRNRDSAPRYVPAAVMLGIATMAARGFGQAADASGPVPAHAQ